MPTLAIRPITADHITLLTAREAASRLGISESSLYRMRCRGELPAVRIGENRWQLRYRASDIADFLDRNTVRSHSPSSASR